MAFFGRRRGFTLIELMIVVAVIGTLAAVAIPKFAELLRKSKEGATKGNLGRIRSALSIYAGDKEGAYPTCTWGYNSSVLSSSLVPKYINKIPNNHNANYHQPTARVLCHQDYTDSHDTGLYQGWVYIGAWASYYCPSYWCTTFASVMLTCRHTDTKGSAWNEY